VAPDTLVAYSSIVLLSHTGLLEDALAVGALFTVTVTVPAELVQPPTVAVTEYVPAAAVVQLGMFGSSLAEVKPLGPVQL
jgi:hypothetical protein